MAQAKRSDCPVACVLDLVGDKWTLLVVRDLACGKSQFKDFMRSPEGIASNILANRLARLVEHGIAEKYTSEPLRSREAYRLTEKGMSLARILHAMVEWGLEHVEGTVVRMTSQRTTGSAAKLARQG